ncbi:transposase-like protein [Paraburkholderia sp. GAS32]
MNKSNKFSAEVRERAVRMVQEHRGEYPSQWAAIESIAPKIGCTSQTLLGWVKRDEVDSGEREGVSTSERERLKALEREVKELRRADEILKLASAFFAQAELDPGHRSLMSLRTLPFTSVKLPMNIPTNEPYSDIAHSTPRTAPSSSS